MGQRFIANQTVLDYTGLTLEDVQREDQRTRVFHPEDLERLREERQEGFARAVSLLNLSNERLEKTVTIGGFLSASIPFATTTGTLFAGMPLGTDIEDRKRAEERMRNEKPCAQGANRFCVHVRGDCGSVSSLAKRALEHRQSGPNRFHGAHHRRNRHRERTDCSPGHTQAFTTFGPGVY